MFFSPYLFNVFFLSLFSFIIIAYIYLLYFLVLHHSPFHAFVSLICFCFLFSLTTTLLEDGTLAQNRTIKCAPTRINHILNSLVWFSIEHLLHLFVGCLLTTIRFRLFFVLACAICVQKFFLSLNLLCELASDTMFFLYHALITIIYWWNVQVCVMWCICHPFCWSLEKQNDVILWKHLLFTSSFFFLFKSSQIIDDAVLKLLIFFISPHHLNTIYIMEEIAMVFSTFFKSQI